MMSPKLLEALNKQIQIEFESSRLYLSMVAYFHDLNLDGMAQWMRVQTDEEYQHAMKIFDHVRDRSVRVKLSGLAQPKTEWASPLEAFEEAYQHELFVTGKIHELVKLAAAEEDFAAGIMLQWFVTEQVEEEASVSKIVYQLKTIGSSGSGLVMLDRQLGKRE